jgi:ABC-type sulfate/molybdate transport systems ATPase subunit
VGLLGPNGAGKSTLLSAVAGLTPVSAGRITLAGQVMDDADSGTFVALVLADQLIVLEGGRIVQQGTPGQIARQPATDYVAKLVGLNLCRGRADGSQVALGGGGSFITPDHGQHGDVLVAVRPSAILVSSARNTWPATITGSPCLPTGSGSTSTAGHPPWPTSRPPQSRNFHWTAAARYGSQSKPPTWRSTRPAAGKIIQASSGSAR